VNLLSRTLAAIPALDADAMRSARARLDSLTKPQGSMGRLEQVAAALAGMRGDPRPLLARKLIYVLAGDHGVAAEGVSLYPSEVTAQMLLNYAGGGAVINSLARRAGAELVVADLGVKAPPGELPGVLKRRIAAGTRNFRREPAMTREQAHAAIEIGIELVRDADVIALGDMGIANSTSAAALIAALCGAPPEDVTGRGTGIDAERWRHKVEVVRDALELHQPDPGDPLGVLAALGGFEIAGLVGLALGAAARRIPVLIDGVVPGAAALVAARLAPRAREFMLAAHRSVEPGHSAALGALALEPLLSLELRLGEASGAALALPLLDAACALLREVASFEEAGVARAC
jgi:nicotinate-nucleotide--dimethylbenzimidazole phosphoribosyltransferase